MAAKTYIINETRNTPRSTEREYKPLPKQLSGQFESNVSYLKSLHVYGTFYILTTNTNLVKIIISKL